MPEKKKAAKKKTQPADFKVLKKKVGRKLKPANATSTKFEAKQVVIREQSVTTDAKDVSITSKRGLTVEQLVPQTRHVNSRVRREALEQLVEIAETKYDQAEAVRNAFSNLFEVMTEAVNDTEMDVRRMFINLLAILLEKDALNSQHVTTLLNQIFAAVTGPMLSRRLDATKCVQQLISSPKYAEFVRRNFPRLLSSFSDICRCVMGATSSSLAKGGSSAGAQVAQKSGRIMQQLKREEELAKINAKRQKAAQEASQAELSVISKSLHQAAQSCRDVLSLRPKEDEVANNIAEELVRALLELFRHSQSGLNEATLVSAEALALACECFSNTVEYNLATDIKDAFAPLTNNVEIARCNLLCAVALKVDRAWLESSFKFFLREKEVQTSDIALRLFNAFHDDGGENGFRIVETMVNDALGGLRSKRNLNRIMSIFDFVLEVFDRIDSNRAIQLMAKPLPSAIWSALGIYGEAALDCASQVLEILRRLALRGQSGDIWAAVCKDLSAFWCAFAKSSGAIVEGPFSSCFDRKLRVQMFAVINALPITRLPSTLIRSWAASLQKFGDDKLETHDTVLMVETVGEINLRDMRLNAGVEPSLSFLLTVALTAKDGYVRHVARSVFIRFLTEAQWPLGSLIAPVLVMENPAKDGPLSSSDVLSRCHAWLEVATVFAATKNSSGSDLLKAVAQNLNMLWASVTRNHNPLIYDGLTGVISVESILQSNPDHRVIAGYLEVALWFEEDDDLAALRRWWGIKHQPAGVLQLIENAAKAHADISANLQLLTEQL